jgi:hypothetical protein
LKFSNGSKHAGIFISCVLVCIGCGSGGGVQEVSDSSRRSEDIVRELDLAILDTVPSTSTTVSTTTTFQPTTTTSIAPTTTIPPTTLPPTTNPPTTDAVDVHISARDDHPLDKQPVTTTTTIIETPPDTDAPDAEERSGGVWDRLAECESGGNWQINTGNGYYGGLQFAKESWDATGGSGYPHEHSREEQIHRAEILLDMQGWGAWPTCSRKIGLR